MTGQVDAITACPDTFRAFIFVPTWRVGKGQDCHLNSLLVETRELKSSHTRSNQLNIP